MRNAGGTKRGRLPWVLGLGALVLLAGAGCEKSRSLEEIQAASDQTSAEVQREVGPEALVAYFKERGKTRVTVSLLETTRQEAEAAKPQVEAIVGRHFPEADTIIVNAVPPD